MNVEMKTIRSESQMLEIPSFDILLFHFGISVGCMLLPR